MTWRKTAGIILCVALASATGAHFLNADRWAPRVQAELARSLERPVRLGKVRLRLWTGPAVIVKDAVIGESQSIGIEPFAYVTSLEVRPRLLALLRGRFEAASLTLTEPSINLVRTAGSRWNIQSFLSRARTPPGARPPAYPDLHIRGGRLNFKIGGVKSVYYLTEADADISASDPGAQTFNLRFAGSPARTDRPAQGFGRLAARGRWTRGGRLEFDLVLERTSIEELTMLALGRDLGLHGLVSSRASLAGPLSDVEVAGRLEIGDVHRWDLMPSRGESWPLDYHGRLNFLDQELAVDSREPSKGKLPVRLRVRARRLLDSPRFALTGEIEKLEVAPLAAVARHLGWPVPEGVQVTGHVDGAFGYAAPAGLQGVLSLGDLTVQARGASPVRVDNSVLVIDGRKMRLRPSEIAVGETGHASIEAGWSVPPEDFELKLAARGVATGELAALASVLSLPRVPVLEHWNGGSWKGAVRFRRGKSAEGAWSGALDVQGAELSMPDLAGPLRLESATLQLEPSKSAVGRMRFAAGGARWSGQYGWQPAARQPHTFHLTSPKASAEQLEAALAPLLRRDEGFLARTLGLRRSAAPDWLATRRAGGTVEIESLDVAGTTLRSVRFGLVWNGTRVVLEPFQATLGGALLAARLKADLSRGTPAVEGTLEITGWPWQDGRLTGQADFETRGTGAALWANLRASGSLAGRGVSVGAEREAMDFEGCFDLSVNRRRPVWRLSTLGFIWDGDAYLGQGGTDSGDRLVLDMASEDRRVRVSGTISPWKLEVIPLKPSN